MCLQSYTMSKRCRVLETYVTITENGESKKEETWYWIGFDPPYENLARNNGSLVEFKFGLPI